MQHFLASEADLLAYETLGRLFANLADGLDVDVERMREIKREYEEKKAALTQANIFTASE